MHVTPKSKVRVRANLPTWLTALGQAHAKALGLTFSELVERLLRQHGRKAGAA